MSRKIFRELISVEEAKVFLINPAISAVGHRGTAELLEEIFDIPIPTARTKIHMQPGDEALIFWSLNRQPSNEELTKDQLKEMPWKLGILRRIK